MTWIETLGREAEPFPAWLATASANTDFDRDAFMSSRVVFYPGAGTDGDGIRVFGKAHAAHCFVHVDYGLGPATLVAELSGEDERHKLRGYRPLVLRDLSEAQLRPGGWRPHVSPADLAAGHRSMTRGNRMRRETQRYALWAVLQREPEYDDRHGPERLAFIHISGDGVATFDALFCQDDGTPAPYAMVLQDHGFGGNWTRFGGPDSPLYQLARDHAMPRWTLVGNGTKPWPSTCRVSDSTGPGGMHRSERYLYRLDA